MDQSTLLEHERDRLGRVAEEVRRLALFAIGSALLVPVMVVSAPGGFKALALLAWLGQIVLGFTAFSVGRGAANDADALNLPVQLAEQAPLRNWSAIALIVGLLGVVGAVLGLALIMLVGSALGAMGGAWGRPLRIGGEQARAELGAGTRWAKGPRPRVDDLDDTTRTALGRMWLHDAIKEHGSVPAFAQLSWELAALGAPPSLLARCQTSALQEIDHAQRCFAAVETYFDAPVRVGPIDAATSGLSRRGNTLRCAKKVALETLEDGCLVEDLNADFAERAHVLAIDPAMSSLTAIIAREEREHAALAWDILRFCVALDPRVANAVRRRLDRLPKHIVIPYDIATAEIIGRADANALSAHGRVPFSEWTALFEHRRTATIARARELLAGSEDSAPEPARASA
jgi:hypothetical protein